MSLSPNKNGKTINLKLFAINILCVETAMEEMQGLPIHHHSSKAPRCKNSKTKTVESITIRPSILILNWFASIVCACKATTIANNEMTSSSIYIYITQAINLSKLHLDVIGALYKCKRQCNDLLSVCAQVVAKLCCTHLAPGFVQLAELKLNHVASFASLFFYSFLFSLLSLV